MEHSRGLKRKDQTSCEKTPYLKRKDDGAKMMKLKGVKVQNDERTHVEDGATEPGQNGTMPVGPPSSGVGSAPHFLSVKMMQP
jgi:hypothetical protein